MRKSRFSEEQIVAIIREYAAGAKVSELCRKHGMSDATFYKWKAKYGGLQVSDVRRLKDLEAESLLKPHDCNGLGRCGSCMALDSVCWALIPLPY